MDLSTRYLGLTLKNPLVPSASPLSEHLDTLRKIEDAGAAAVVIYSLFEEQINAALGTRDRYLGDVEQKSESMHGYYPDPEVYRSDPETYLEHIRKAKEALDIPVIASLNGVSSGGWITYARQIEAAGADALELNIYYIPTDLGMTGAEVEKMYLDVVYDVRQHISIPLAVKLSPFFSAMKNMAYRLYESGANGLVLFNRFFQPDFDLETLEVVPHLSLSTSEELRLPLRWVAILHNRFPLDLAITSGVHTYEDVIKGLLAGANVTMMASELLRNGIGRIEDILGELTRWLEARGYGSVADIRGLLGQMNVTEPAAYERANYIKGLHEWNRTRPAASSS